MLRHVDALSQATQTTESSKGSRCLISVDPPPVLTLRPFDAAFAIAEVLSECVESLHESWALTGYPVVVVATTDRPEETAPRIASCFKHELSFFVRD